MSTKTIEDVRNDEARMRGFKNWDDLVNAARLDGVTDEDGFRDWLNTGNPAPTGTSVTLHTCGRATHYLGLVRYREDGAPIRFVHRKRFTNRKHLERKAAAVRAHLDKGGILRSKCWQAAQDYAAFDRSVYKFLNKDGKPIVTA